MFLYKKDYSHLSLDHYHLNTKNRSFMKMHLVYKAMGVENNAMFLLCTQPELMKYDPHDLKDTSDELKLKIMLECKINPWYCLREVIRVPGGGLPTEFRLSRPSVYLIWGYLNRFDTALLMLRQQGKTVTALALTIMVNYFLGRSFEFTMVAHTDKLKKGNIDRLKQFRDALPKWMVLKGPDDINNMETVKYGALNNTYSGLIGNRNVLLADKQARGITTPSIHWDEMPHIANVHLMYTIALQSTEAAIKKAKESGEMYGNIITTTAGYLDTKEGRFTYDLFQDSLPFNETMFDVEDRETMIEMIRLNSPQGMIYGEFNHRDLGITDEEHATRKARARGTEDVLAMELDNVWLSGAAGGILSPDDKSRLEAQKKPALFSQYLDGFIVNWHIPKNLIISGHTNTIPIVIGTDTSEAIGRDWCTFVFVDVRDASVCATCRINRKNLFKVAMFVVRLLTEFNVLWIPERNSTASAIIDIILIALEDTKVNPFEVIYSKVVQERHVPSMSKVPIELADSANEYRKHFGRRTTGGDQGRDFLYNTVFFEALERHTDRLTDGLLISEIVGLVSKDGKIDHTGDAHDDLVIGWILAMFVILYGENLRNYRIFKKDPSILLRDVRKTRDDRFDKIIETVLRLKNQLEKTTNSSSKLRLSSQIRLLEEKLPPESMDKMAEIGSIQEMNNDKPKSIVSENVQRDRLNRMLSLL